MIFGFKESGLWNMTLNIHLFKKLKMSRKEQSHQMLGGLCEENVFEPQGESEEADSQALPTGNNYGLLLLKCHRGEKENGVHAFLP